MTTKHDIIYLQVCEDEESEWLGEVTWCQDRVNNDDVKYIRADLVKQQLAAKQAKIDALMLEYCPSEMSQEQLDTWAAHQRPAKED